MENKKWLIDVNEFRKIFWSKLQDLKFIGPFDVEHIILNTPKVDAVEVAHGQWLPTSYMIPSVMCSECSYPVGKEYKREFKYCPSCGAKMDLED